MLQVALVLQGFDQGVAIYERCRADWTLRAFLLFSCVVAVVTLGFVMERVNETLSHMLVLNPEGTWFGASCFPGDREDDVIRRCGAGHC